MKKIALLTLITIAAGSAQSSAQGVKNDSTVTLKEFVVSVAPKQVKTQGAVTTVRVKGTQLSRLGNATDVLANTPGLHKGGSGIEVNGMGRPIFVVGGREIDPGKVLDMLQSDKIKEVRIDRAPTGEFSTTGQPVVEIILYQPANDYMSLSVGNAFALRRRISDAANIDFGIQKGKFTSTVTLLGGGASSENRETYFRNVYNQSVTSTFNQSRKSVSTEYPVRLRWVTDFKISREQRLGFEYYYQHSGRTIDESGTDRYAVGGSETNSFIDRADKRNNNLHNFTLQYNLTKKKWTMQLVEDFAISDGNSSVNAKESAAGLNSFSDVATWSDSRYRTSATHLKVTAKLPFKINLTAGGRYNYVNSDRLTHSDNRHLSDGKYRLISDVEEHSPQAYLNLRKKFSKLSVTAGVRYMYVHRVVTSHTEGNAKNEVRQIYSSLLPNLTMTYTHGNNLSAYLRYNRLIEQPSFSSINSGLTYSDSLTYSDGNPDIRAAYINRISLGVTLRDFTFAARWTHTSHPIVEVYQPESAGSDIVIGKSINLPSSRDVSFSLAYSRTISRLNLYAEGEVVCPSGKYEFLDREMNANKMSFNANANVSLRITNNLGAYTTFSYQGRRTNLTLMQRSVNNWTVGLTGAFLRSRLMVNLSFTDILHKANYNNLTFRYGRVENGTFGTNDERGVMLRLSYTIFNKNIKTRASRDNDEILDRIY